jgi:hypothetical protein
MHTWKEEGNCYADPSPDMWFPADPNDPVDVGPTVGEAATYAAAQCATCPVFDACEAFAKTNKVQYGIWAGKLYGV